MICLKQNENMLRIVFQPDHARHAALLVRQWIRPTQLPPNLWERLITAVEHHDDGWHMHKYQPLIDEQGTPYSFMTLPLDTHIKYLHYCIKTVMKDDVYQALLITLHFKWVVSNYPTYEQESKRKIVKDFLSWSDSTIDKAIARLRNEEPPEHQEALTRTNLRLAQKILSFNDKVSLMLIGALPWSRFDEPVNYSINEVVIRYRDDEWGVCLDPWPFEEPFFSIHVNSRTVADKVYKSSEEFFDAMGNAPTNRIVHRIMPY